MGSGFAGGASPECQRSTVVFSVCLVKGGLEGWRKAPVGSQAVPSQDRGALGAPECQALGTYPRVCSV